jgi:hypothetical protein
MKYQIISTMQDGGKCTTVHGKDFPALSEEEIVDEFKGLVQTDQSLVVIVVPVPEK